MEEQVEHYIKRLRERVGEGEYERHKELVRLLARNLAIEDIIWEEISGVSGYNKPKRTPKHPKKSHVVVAKVGSKTKLIRFGQQGVSTAGKKTDKKSNARRKSFKARHGKNIKKGKMSAAYWANKVKW
jgi:hypothetical protein